jgi:hypothetical protein
MFNFECTILMALRFIYFKTGQTHNPFFSDQPAARQPAAALTPET